MIYSLSTLVGQNKVPTVAKFLQNLDKDKQERDRILDQAQQGKPGGGDAVPHKAEPAGKEGTRKTVRDPTTEKDVVIEDVNKDMMKAVESPTVGRHSMVMD